MSRSQELQAEYRRRQARLMGLLWDLYCARLRKAGNWDEWMARYPPKDRLERFCEMLEQLIEEE